jgi:hypothetical protein
LKRVQPWLPGFSTRRRQQQQIGALELASDFAPVGAELCIVDRVERINVMERLGHRILYKNQSIGVVRRR